MSASAHAPLVRPRVASRLSGHGELLRTLLRRELRAKYKGSALGILWSFLYPVAMMGVYTLVFSVLFRAVGDIEHYPLFVLVGMAAWAFLQGAVQLSVPSIVFNGGLVRSVWFPRELIPTAIVLAQAVTAAIMFAILIPVCLLVEPEALRTVAFVIPVFAAFICLALGLSWILATLNVFFRDVEHLMAVLFLPWFFLTPILYSLEALPKAAEHTWIVQLLRWGNPATPYVESIRGAILQGGFPGPSMIAYIFVVGPALALIGLWAMQRYEDRFAIEV